MTTVLAAGVFLLSALPQSWSSAEPTPEPASPLEGLDRVDWTGWSDLAALLADVRARTGVPAIAAAWVNRDGTIEQATTGVVAAGSGLALDADTAFALGSVTKSITAAVIARLVEEGRLAWDTRVDAVLPDVAIDPGYAGVTLEQLLRHRGGLAAWTSGRPRNAPAMHEPGDGATPTEKRAAFVACALATPPIAPPGTRTEYSNAGYVVAGHMAERVAGTSWEDLVRRCVFVPLDLRSGAFGVPASPSGHVWREGAYEPVPPGAHPDTEPIGPAGSVRLSIGDLARFARAHLAGLAGRDGFLRHESVSRLHSGGEDGGYACGWAVRREADGSPVHSHGGTLGDAWAEVRLFPARGTAAMVLLTVEPGIAEPIANRVLRALRARHDPSPEAAVDSRGFTFSPGATPRTLKPTERPADPGDDARHWKAIEALANALNDEDLEAYLALFAPSYSRDSAESLFDFMATSVLPVRGALRAFHALGPPLEIEPGRPTMRVAVFHLENGFPGCIGLVFDAQERIAEISLFVKDELCPNGTDPRCPLITRRLGDGAGK